MIPKLLDTIVAADLQALIDNEVRESKTIEYKRELPGNADSEKVPFLAAVSSFANTSGGDLLLGVEAEGGLPTAFPGLDIPDLDREKLRLEQIVANGLEPRLPRIDLHPVEVADGQHVVVVRVPKSWTSPHRVKKNNQFYGRNSAGKYPLDVGELRTAFTLSETVAERIRSLRADRIGKVYGGETPVALQAGGRMILHLLPLAAFTEASAIDLTDHYGRSEQLHPIGSSEWNGRLNLDGVVTWSGVQPEGAYAYTQLFRSGAVEGVSVVRERDGCVVLSSVFYEQYLVEALREYLAKLWQLGLNPPIYVFLSFVGMKGCRFPVESLRMLGEERPPLRENNLVLPEVVVDQQDVDAGRVLHPVFDRVWNAFGLAGSENYNREGNWVGRQ